VRFYEKEHSVIGSLPESVPVPIMHQIVEENKGREMIFA